MIVSPRARSTLTTWLWLLFYACSSKKKWNSRGSTLRINQRWMASTSLAFGEELVRLTETRKKSDWPRLTGWFEQFMFCQHLFLFSENCRWLLSRAPSRYVPICLSCVRIAQPTENPWSFVQSSISTRHNSKGTLAWTGKPWRSNLPHAQLAAWRRKGIKRNAWFDN